MTVAGLRINYLLQETTLFGGVKVTFQHAELLQRDGHEVRVVSPDEAPKWYPVRVPFVRVEALTSSLLPEADIHVATYWTTIAAAAEAASGQCVHFCQGYEGEYLHNRADHPKIESVYRTPVPAVAVSPHLVDLLLQRYGRPGRVASPPLEPFWQPRRRLGPRRPARVLVSNPFENDWKGVRAALEAVRLLRQRGVQVVVVRVSQWPLSEAERHLLEPDEFHYRIQPPEVARLLAGCDLALVPSWEQEGFGLPALEAMACGVPVVASAIPSFEWFADEAAVLVPPRDPQAVADAAQAILGNRRRWWRMRRAGYRVARRFSETAILDRLQGAVQWVVSEAWRDELTKPA